MTVNPQPSPGIIFENSFRVRNSKKQIVLKCNEMFMISNLIINGIYITLHYVDIQLNICSFWFCSLLFLYFEAKKNFQPSGKVMVIGCQLASICRKGQLPSGPDDSCGFFVQQHNFANYGDGGQFQFDETGRAIKNKLNHWKNNRYWRHL